MLGLVVLYAAFVFAIMYGLIALWVYLVGTDKTLMLIPFFAAGISAGELFRKLQREVKQ
jgi:hypothetical protein